jgi:hypothetical protein
MGKTAAVESVTCEQRIFRSSSIFLISSMPALTNQIGLASIPHARVLRREEAPECIMAKEMP